MTDHVLVINCGSSSLKFAAIDPRTGVAALTGLAERLGSPEASLSARLGEDRHGVTLAGGGHEAAMRAVRGSMAANFSEELPQLITRTWSVISTSALQKRWRASSGTSAQKQEKTVRCAVEGTGCPNYTARGCCVATKYLDV
jgi:hypothetical protein